MAQATIMGASPRGGGRMPHTLQSPQQRSRCDRCMPPLALPRYANVCPLLRRSSPSSTPPDRSGEGHSLQQRDLLGNTLPLPSNALPLPRRRHRCCRRCCCCVYMIIKGRGNSCPRAEFPPHFRPPLLPPLNSVPHFLPLHTSCNPAPTALPPSLLSLFI